MKRLHMAGGRRGEHNGIYPGDHGDAYVSSRRQRSPARNNIENDPAVIAAFSLGRGNRSGHRRPAVMNPSSELVLRRKTTEVNP